MRFRRHVFVCENVRAEDDPRGSCGRKGSAEIRKALKDELKRRGLEKQIRANAAGCLDACAFGPSIVVYPEGVWYGHVSVADVPEIVERHLVGGEPVERLRMRRLEGDRAQRDPESPPVGTDGGGNDR
jgi:(2Fe-2S) ferredoxin